MKLVHILQKYSSLINQSKKLTYINAIKLFANGHNL